jgi:uncharacterized protein (TIGR03032 family)
MNVRGTIMTIKNSAPTIEYRDVRCAHSENLPELLTRLRVSILISTYQTGHLVVVAARSGRLVLTFHQFERAMGIAVKPAALAVCTRKEVWFARSAPDIAAKLEPQGQYDACFLTRTAHFTGDIRAHECAWAEHEFVVVNTLFSCIAALHPIYSFTPRWRPPFVSALVPEDRCHLNGMAMVNGVPRFATALAETDTHDGWRSAKTTGGCILEIPSGRFVARGLSLPHSPRVENGRVYFLESGTGRCAVVDPVTGIQDVVGDLPGVARGMALHGGYAFVGLSKARPSLDGVPIVAHRDRLKCGLAVVDLATGTIIADLEFRTGVDEIFDVQALPGIAFPFISGPCAERDTGQPLWTVPPGKSNYF